MSNKKIPVNCPSCTEMLRVEKLSCGACGTSVSGNFPLPVFLQLNAAEQDFLLRFVKSSGSLKEMARQLGYSYPKVRNMLDDLIGKINEIENHESGSQ